MPFRDGTGPLGQGPATGRGMGWCRGWIKGRNYPQGRFGWFRQGVSQPEEKEMLREEADMLREDLKEIEKRLEELEEKK